MITLQLIGITVVLALSFKILISEGMLLEKLGVFLERKVYDEGKKVYDLLFCPWCPTLHSIVAHFVAFGLGVLPFQWDWTLLIRWPIVIGGASIIAGNIWNVYGTINQIRERNEAEAKYYKSIVEDIDTNDN